MCCVRKWGERAEETDEEALVDNKDVKSVGSLSEDYIVANDHEDEGENKDINTRKSEDEASETYNERRDKRKGNECESLSKIS